MVRRSFRLAVRLGLLAGVTLAVVKLVQARRSSREDAWSPPSGAETWPPLQPEPVAVEPLATTVPDRIPPVTKATAPEVDAPPAPSARPPADTAAGAEEPFPATVPPADPADLAETPTATPSMAPAAPSEPAAPAPPAAPAAPASRAKPAKRATPAAPVEPPPDTTITVPPMPSASSAAEPADDGAAPADPARARRAAKRPREPGTRRVRRRQPWVEAIGSECPTTHPVKAKLASMLYHLPGMAAYNRTRPDRCYLDGPAAEADGFIRAKR